MEKTLATLLNNQTRTNRLLILGPAIVILTLIAVAAYGTNRERSLSDRLNDLERFKRIQIDFDEASWEILNDPSLDTLQRLKAIKEKITDVKHSAQ